MCYMFIEDKKFNKFILCSMNNAPKIFYPQQVLEVVFESLMHVLKWKHIYIVTRLGNKR